MKYLFMSSKKISNDPLPAISYHRRAGFLCNNQTDSSMGECIFGKLTDQIFTKNFASVCPTCLKFFSFSNTTLRSKRHRPCQWAHFFGMPGVRRARPFLLLRLSTFLPEVVVIRFRNPCFLFLFTRLG